MLPLDLHVLGLSLAFILSQDQTLRCKIKFVCLAQNNLNLLCTLLTGTVIILNSEFWILNYTFFQFPNWVVSYSLVVHHWLIKLSKITIFRLNFRSLRNRLQRYCFFLDWPNFKATFLHYFFTFFVSGWFSALRFSVSFASFNRSLAFVAKSAAKVLLFYELTKF